jgi:hypothetical protein
MKKREYTEGNEARNNSERLPKAVFRVENPKKAVTGLHGPLSPSLPLPVN